MKLTIQLSRKLLKLFVLLKRRLAITPRSGILSCSVYQMPDTNVVILRCSHFSSISAGSASAVSVGLNDIFLTNVWDFNSHNEAHKWNIAWLKTEVAELKQYGVRIMIFIHRNPFKDARTRVIDLRHAASLITSAFSIDLFKEQYWKPSCSCTRETQESALLPLQWPCLRISKGTSTKMGIWKQSSFRSRSRQSTRSSGRGGSRSIN